MSGTTGLTPLQVLALPMHANSVDAATVRDYLGALLLTLWWEGEGFSGKRPFGDSGWQCDLYVPLVEAGVISGKLDEDGYVEEADEAAASKVIGEAIRAMTAPPGREVLAGQYQAALRSAEILEEAAAEARSRAAGFLLAVDAVEPGTESDR